MVEDTPRIIITIHLCAVCRRWLACQRILEELDLNYGDAWTEGGSRGNLRLEPDWAAFREQIEGGALMAILTEYYTVKVRRDSCGACRAGAYKNAKGGA